MADVAGDGEEVLITQDRALVPMTVGPVFPRGRMKEEHVGHFSSLVLSKVGAVSQSASVSCSH